MDYLAKSFEKTTAGERVPVPPPEYLPVRGLALWKKMPYDSKHPLQPRPRMDLTLKCKEIGESLYESYPNKNFELCDGPPPAAIYDSLHDPYLRFFFRSGHVFRNLLHRGLVTLDGRVKMKLPEFNEYRRYLFRLWVFHVNQLMREEEEEENKCYDQIFEAFEKGNPYFDDLFDDEDYFNADKFLAQLTVSLYKNEDINTQNPLIRSLMQWLQYEERLQRNYGENYPAIRDWLRNPLRNKRMLEKKINMRRSKDNYLRDRWEALKANSEETYEKVTRIQEKQRTKFQMLSDRRQSKVRKMWARSDPRNMKKTPRVQDNLATKDPIDGKVFRYSKNVNLGEDWDDFGKETESPAAKLEEKYKQDEEIQDSEGNQKPSPNLKTLKLKKTSLPYKTYQPKTVTPQKTKAATQKLNQSRQREDSKTQKNQLYSPSTSEKTQRDQRKVSPDSKKVEEHSFKGIKSATPSSTSKPRKTSMDKIDQEHNKIPLVKSESKEKTNTETELSEQEHSLPGRFEDSDLQDHRPEELQSIKSEEEEKHTDLEVLRTREAKTPGSNSTTEEHKEAEGTSEELPKNLLTKKSILEILSSGEDREVPPSEVLVPTSPTETSEDMGNGPNSTDVERTQSVFNKIDENIERLESYLHREQISSSQFEETGKHEKEGVPKSFIKDREQDRFHED